MPRFHGLALAELYGALRQQVDYQRLPIAHGWPMCAPRRIDDPTRAVAVELRVAGERHHHVDFAVRVCVVRTDDIFHLHDVDRKAVSPGSGLHDSSKPNAAGYATAHPPRGDPVSACRENGVECRAVGGEQFAEFLGEHRIDPASFDASGDRSDQHGEFLGRHEIRSTAGNETDVHFRLAFYACQATYIIHSASLPAVRTPPSPMAHGPP